MPSAIQLLIHIIEVQNIHGRARQNTAVSVLLDTDLLQHLAYDNLDMLIVDFYTLQTIYSLYFTQHVILDRTDSLDLQQIVRVNATFGQFITGLQIPDHPEP